MQSPSRNKLCLVSGHYGSSPPFAKLTEKILAAYAQHHRYDFFYDRLTPCPMKTADLHFRRCLLLQKAAASIEEVDWFVWVDTDIYVKEFNARIEKYINLDDKNILYHVFHEKPWNFPINTGVKFVHRKAIKWEKEIYSFKDETPYPFEQKVVIERIFPKYRTQIKVHDPDHLNCLKWVHDEDSAIFVHLAGRSNSLRNLVILREVYSVNKKYDIGIEDSQLKYYHLIVFYLWVYNKIGNVKRRLQKLRRIS